MQINLQHVFKMSASRTRACIGTFLAYTSDVQRDRQGADVMLLTQKLLPVIRQISGNEFVFQQDSAPAHGARATIELLRRETDFMSPEQWPPNCPDLNPVDYKIWATMQQRVYQTKIRNVELRQRLLNVWSSIE